MIIYSTLISSWALFVYLFVKRAIRLNPKECMILFVFGAVYGLLYEFIFGEWMGLYYYYSPAESAYWILVMNVLVYPIYHVLYANWLENHTTFWGWAQYTALWMLAMLVSEFLTIQWKVIVLTGWQIWPWSFVTYLSVYLLDTIIYWGYLKRHVWIKLRT